MEANGGIPKRDSSIPIPTWATSPSPCPWSAERPSTAPAHLVSERGRDRLATGYHARNTDQSARATVLASLPVPLGTILRSGSAPLVPRLRPVISMQQRAYCE